MEELMVKVVAIIQARMGSSRLPGKMLKEIEGKPLIFHVINRVKKSKKVQKIILATTEKEEDKVLLEKAKEYEIESFAGIRLTGDNPFVDPEMIDFLIDEFHSNDWHYASNTTPPTFPDGMDIEVFSFSTLNDLWKYATNPRDREHVTFHIRENSCKYKIFNLNYENDLSHLRFTVDNKEDLEFARKIYSKLKTNFGFRDILKIIEKYPELLKINQKYKSHPLWKEHCEPEIKNSEWLKKAKEIIPIASQTYSKSYKYFCEGVGPEFLDRGLGGHVWDIKGKEYIDFVCGLGAITLGYNNPEIDNEIISQLKKGISFSLPTILEVKLAEKIIKILPCAEMVKFVKNGSDATTAAIRLARAYTGKDIVACCGYHGYHDWFIGTTKNNLGVPLQIRELTKSFEYNNIESLKRIFDKHKGKIAAVIIEPCQDNGPKDNFLEKIRELCKDNNTLLIFDEVVSGFRMRLGGAQEYYNIIPDLGCFGKGMGNGMPISLIAGKKEIMKLIEDRAFISTTFGGETLSIVAALKTIEILERKKSFEHIWRLGNKWKEKTDRLIKEHGLGNVVRVNGLAPHCGVIFKGLGNLSNLDLLSIYQQKLLEKGILSVGINNFCLAHTEEDVDKFTKAVDEALYDVKTAIQKNSLYGLLKGGKIRPIFER